MEEIKELIEHFNYLYEEISNENYEAEDKVADLEEKIDQMIEDYSYQDDYHFKGEPKELDALKKLKNDVKKMKREFNFYDEQAELDRMFPNRHDEDFDEDDMGFRSVFGDD
jgi:poly-gamma-glutamate capsule biosynthesis protein CapA/YwtB (metallophosphatase superfamily)